MPPLRKTILPKILLAFPKSIGTPQQAQLLQYATFHFISVYHEVGLIVPCGTAHDEDATRWQNLVR